MEAERRLHDIERKCKATGAWNTFEPGVHYSYGSRVIFEDECIDVVKDDVPYLVREMRSQIDLLADVGEHAHGLPTALRERVEAYLRR
ncbi:MAG: hypothetical protein M3P49_14305 [Actinomycetota bacterium]|nr:hypothetical protein [Actinomycetota bacterium]